MGADTTAISGLAAPGPGVVLLAFGDRWALFHQGRQELAEINETARLIWQGLCAGLSVTAVGEAVGVDADEVAGRWVAQGWMVPVGVADGAPMARIALSILDVGFTLEVAGGAPDAELSAFLSPITGGEGGEVLRLAAVGDKAVLFADGVSRGTLSGDEVIPAVKGALAQRLIARIDDGFAAHGALLERGGRRMFLSGAPGAGKSTLAVALAGAGFALLSDDIVQVDRQGRVRGACFPPALKTGSWELLEGLAGRATHRRADGQAARYLPELIADAPAGRLDFFVVLDRQAQGPAGLTALSGLEGLRALLASASSPAGRIGAHEMAVLGARFAGVGCVRLTYSDLEGAVRALTTLADG